MRRIGILTGGGDVPGLNPCIKAFVSHALDLGHEVVGIRRGWAGLLHFDLADTAASSERILPLTRSNTRTIDRSGGTFLHTSRTNPANVKAREVPPFLRNDAQKDDGSKYDFTPQVLAVLAHLKIDLLVAIGGDDTLSYALRLHKEGFPVIAIPKTMDNDVFGTDYCIGFSTAITRSVDFITDLRTAAGSHERVAIVELFGRNSGETSLIAGYLAGVDRSVISEVPFDPERLAAFLTEDKKSNPSNYAIMTISEGATMTGKGIVETGEADTYGHRKLGGIGAQTGELIKQLTGSNIIYQQLAYLMRSGAPDALDRMVATSYAVLAAQLIRDGTFGMMTALRGGKYTVVPIDGIMQGKKRVDVAELYDPERYQPRIGRMLDKPMFLY